MKEYKERNELLIQMGFPSYRAYLKSSLWKRIRARVHKRDKNTCRICKVHKSEHVHHMRYDKRTLKGDTLKYLIAICAGCHELGEINWDRSKTEMPDCNKKLEKIRKSHAKRKQETIFICFVCKKNKVSRINGKCKSCQKNR